MSYITQSSFESKVQVEVEVEVEVEEVKILFYSLTVSYFTGYNSTNN